MDLKRFHSHGTKKNLKGSLMILLKNIYSDDTRLKQCKFFCNNLID